MTPESVDLLTTVYPSVDEFTLTQLYCNFSSLSDDFTSNGSQLFCTVNWDGVSCWPPALAGSTAMVPCFSELNGVKYDTSKNATRDCLRNASWSSWSNYRSCIPLTLPEDEYLKVLWDMRDAVTVYYVGYGISLIALSLALWIFVYFKELRCLRNTIHANLMFTYLLLDITWICTAKLQSSQNYIANRVACFLTIFLTYLMGTNFFWMFVEGLYLFILVVKTFTVDNIKMYVYAVIGWVLPALVVATWAGVKGHVGNTIEDVLAPQGCPWQRRDYYDYIFISPVILVLMHFFILYLVHKENAQLLTRWQNPISSGSSYSMRLCIPWQPLKWHFGPSSNGKFPLWETNTFVKGSTRKKSGSCQLESSSIEWASIMDEKLLLFFNSSFTFTNDMRSH
ncbi:Diuretic hormone receptor like protein [Argiope bruennichi]|uniref:Diuretic hormone receptor like protein n=1 Tax=Argiope bruennichi TaxID=94029 RepID=A0A8T0FU76_ARGBR|nr:Diuretic hormone receptor like protein [Argiope bruennichi]